MVRAWERVDHWATTGCGGPGPDTLEGGAIGLVPCSSTLTCRAEPELGGEVCAGCTQGGGVGTQGGEGTRGGGGHPFPLRKPQPKDTFRPQAQLDVSAGGTPCLGTRTQVVAPSWRKATKDKVAPEKAAWLRAWPRRTWAAGQPQTAWAEQRSSDVLGS